MSQESVLLQSAEGAPMVLDGVDARGRLRGLLFDLAVEQRYRNPLPDNVEAVYTFPLPLDAVLLDLAVDIGGRRLHAAVVEKHEAEERYEDALEAGDSAVMLERSGDGLCTLNLGNLMPGERATIRYRYAQLLRFAHGGIRLAIPTVIAPRYGDPADAGLAPHQVPVTDLGARYAFGLVLDLEGDVARGRIASPSHGIDVEPSGTGVRISLAEAACLDRDFIVTVDGLSGCPLVDVARDGEGCVALASFCAEAPGEAASLPLSLRLLVDCSGSMAGDSIAAARRALHDVLARLEPRDRFSLTRFGSTVRHETDGLQPANAFAIRAGAQALAAMDADLGGTAMEHALRAVFALGTPGEAGDVLVITDGEVWGAPGLVAAANAARQRVFVVGIGSAPAEGVLRGLAEASGGACDFVAPREDVQGAIRRMFARMRAARIARAEVRWPAVPSWTAPLPAGLFAGETIHAFAGFAAAPHGEATLSLVPAADAVPLRAKARMGDAVADDDTLARVGAAQRLAHLDGAEQLALALRYRLLTDRTNLVVVAERAAGKKAHALPKPAIVAQMHAAGWHGLGSVCSRVACLPQARPEGAASRNVDFYAMDDLEMPAPALGQLFADGLPEAWRPLLDRLVREGFAAGAICAALLAALARRLLAAEPALPRHVARHLREWSRAHVAPALRGRLDALLLAGLPDEAATLAWVRARAVPLPAF